MALTKVVIVLDCNYDETVIPEDDLGSMVADFVENTVCTLHSLDPFYLTNTTVYTDLADFDRDRADKVDHFGPDLICAA